jgi:hypothetical protein
MAQRGYNHGLYTGQFGMMHIDSSSNPARYDREHDNVKRFGLSYLAL